MTFPGMIKAERIKHGLSQKELGEISECTQQQIQSYEAGKIRPRLDNMYRICSALKSIELLKVYSVETDKIVPEELYRALTGERKCHDIKEIATFFDQLDEHNKELLIEFAKILLQKQS